ncbi:hypothetical protein K7Z54_23505 [Mycobacterium avium subsp. hominissuis]|uniref:hypothetical protein n=1 Tax=Mycobacterium avium TaxID=1764 RepID=UPI002939A01A|nr:hypothetical protein [Mycobacterium avium]MDV3249552.1 hypothetical protein [Mycobacterium avium subsp. hominissuis]MDV3276633.1 hypothetical protein [Mycobacterium avium subsp. hominissuis]MDV3324205.1 hypothetical protein [Mycobacterium avium subsp. hominissuis]
MADDDFHAVRAFGHTAMAICERLLDHPDDPDAQSAARQLIDDNPEWELRAHLLIAALPG